MDDLARPETLFATHSAGKRVFKPSITKAKRDQKYRGRSREVACSKGWLKDGEPGLRDDSFPDCVEIVDHGEELWPVLGRQQFGEGKERKEPEMCMPSGVIGRKRSAVSHVALGGDDLTTAGDACRRILFERKPGILPAEV